MNALPSDLIRRTSELSEAVTQPISGSRKIHVEGPSGVRVPMREVVLGDTPKLFGAEKNHRSRCMTLRARIPTMR